MELLRSLASRIQDVGGFVERVELLIGTMKLIQQDYVGVARWIHSFIPDKPGLMVSTTAGLTIPHDPKYPKPWEVRCSSRLRSGRSCSIDGNYTIRMTLTHYPLSSLSKTNWSISYLYR